MGDWSRYGYYVGCEYLGNYPHTQFGSGKAYPEAIWYSFPGYCPNEDFPHKTEQCAAQEPGGYTGGKKDGGPVPTGAGDSTYTFEEQRFLCMLLYNTKAPRPQIQRGTC